MVFAAQRTLIATDGAGIIDQPVTLALPIRHIALQLALFLGAQLAVAGLVDVRCGVILTDSELLVRPFDPLLYAASAQSQQRR